MMHPNNHENHEEKLIQKFSESLNKLEVPDKLRESNRNSIRNAMGSVETKAVWYRKKLSVPMPIAAGFLLVLSFQLLLFGFQISKINIDDIDQAQSNSADQLEPSEDPYYSEQGVYIAGIGFVEKSQHTFCRLENHYENN